MFTIKLKCPHCIRETHFRLLNVCEYYHKEPVKTGSVNNTHNVSVRSINESTHMKAYGVATCPECESPVLIWFECNYGQLQQAQRSSNQAEWRYTGELPKILGTYPSPQNPDDSPYYPQGLRAIFVELQEDILMNRTPARIVSGCRSVLEVALRSLGYEKNNLISRIEQARNDGIITESMKDWSHRVRINGNEAVHELQATQEEASEFVSFLKLFLEVVFVLPERIKQQQPHP